MTKMYVANVTEKIHEFNYTAPELSQGRRIKIQPRSQVKLPDDLNMEQVKAIVQHHEPYGFAQANEAGKGYFKGHLTELVFSLDKPVPHVTLALQYESNHHVLFERGKQTRRETAIASSVAAANEIETKTRNTELHDRQEMKNFSTLLQAEDGPDGHEADPVNDHFGVDQPLSPMVQTGSGKRKGGK